MNHPAYFEIQAEDAERAVKFYKEVFGWSFSKDENLPIPYYRIQTDGPNGGILQPPIARPAQKQGTNAYTISMIVDNFDLTAEKILKNGGIIAMEKFEIPGKCWQGYFLDTEGNVFGIFEVIK
jgi:predicted enzyme related to lactoylglutathione lyase